MYEGLLKQYQAYLPVTEKTPMISLAEGNTSLVPLLSLSKELGIQLYGKYEGLNPTGSFKNRGMVMAIAKAVEEDAKAIACASTGSTSAAAAMYATGAGIKAYIVIPEGKITLGKSAQVIMYEADIISISGNFDEALKAVREIAKTEVVALINSMNPYRLKGRKTTAFGACEQLGQAPDVLTIPVGNTGNISAYWKGFKGWHERQGTTLPRMHGFEAGGAATIVKGQVIEQPETVATAIRVGDPASWQLAEQVRNESDGFIDATIDQEILTAYWKITAQGGVFIESGSTALLARAIQHVKGGKIKAGETIAAVFIGNGLKDLDTAMETEVTISKMSDVEGMCLHLRKGVAMLWK